jgi:hypothetical protein
MHKYKQTKQLQKYKAIQDYLINALWGIIVSTQWNLVKKKKKKSKAQGIYQGLRLYFTVYPD